VTVVGCNAVFNSDVYKARDFMNFVCEGYSECPNDWLARERFFAAAAIITFILSIGSIAFGFIMDGSIRIAVVKD